LIENFTICKLCMVICISKRLYEGVKSKEKEKRNLISEQQQTIRTEVMTGDKNVVEERSKTR